MKSPTPGVGADHKSQGRGEGGGVELPFLSSDMVCQEQFIDYCKVWIGHREERSNERCKKDIVPRTHATTIDLPTQVDKDLQQLGGGASRLKKWRSTKPMVKTQDLPLYP